MARGIRVTVGTVLTALLVARLGVAQNKFIEDPASYVIPFIGTTAGGHVFPGATLPHGMVKVGMDTDSDGPQAGYDANPAFNVIGFSQLHDSGTGGGLPMMNFKIFPVLSCPSFEQCGVTIENRKLGRKILADGTPDDFASPGYFASNLTNGIHVELTSTRRTALHRYTFPAGTQQPRLIVDITNDGSRSAIEPFMKIDPDTTTVTGGAEYGASFGPGHYKAYTCVTFKGDGFDLGKPTEYGAWLNQSPIQRFTELSQFFFGGNDQGGALLTFNPAPGGGPTTVLVRVGVSLISTDQACQNAVEEIPDFDFDGVHSTSRAQWNELLGRIQVDPTGVPEDTVKLFYSSFYRTHISPADYTGENPRWNSTEPYFDSFYCNWDTYRTLYPLMSLHDGQTFANIVRGMIDIQRNEGWLPECRGITVQHYIQGGSNGDPILAEFLVKFSDQAKDLGVNVDDLYTALVADAEDEPANWNLQGRQANAWKQYGYVPADHIFTGGANTRQVSRTVEYAFGDFAISQVAKLLGKQDDAKKYAQRAGNFVNVWNANLSIPGISDFNGMMQLRYVNGSFAYTDPRHCSVNDPTSATCYLDATNFDGFYEGSPVTYSQYVPQDTAKLIDMQGGADKFVERLDWIFQQKYFDVTDEPSQQIPFMYHYANKPGASTQRSRQIISQSYTTAVNGLPGNDDSGAMGSFAAFYLLGLYPLPATRQLLLSSPYFSTVSFYNPVFKTTTTIKTNGFVGNPSDGKGGTVFVKSVTVDGQPYKSNCYLEWDIFEKGSTVELTLTNDMNTTCGDGAAALPPSLSTGGYD